MQEARVSTLWERASTLLILGVQEERAGMCLVRETSLGSKRRLDYIFFA